jgi:hypothetical protein
MAVGLQNLFNICSSNIVELKFVRRNKMRIPSTRRMLCTLDSILLNSEAGKNLLNFRPPTNPPRYNARARGLLTVWDIIMQDYRNIPVDAIEIVTAIPTRPMASFLKFFNQRLSKMSSMEKLAFMEK